jgi:hypothetical protein
VIVTDVLVVRLEPIPARFPNFIDRPIILLTGWPLILLSGLAYQCLSDCNRCACSEAETYPCPSVKL